MRDDGDLTLEGLREHLVEGDRQCVEWCPLCRTADLWREYATPELREQWLAVQVEALLAVRALIDHYLERVERDGRSGGPAAAEIPAE